MKTAVIESKSNFFIGKFYKGKNSEFNSQFEIDGMKHQVSKTPICRSAF
ncbi:hypothetical protein NMS_1452 [Nonlabens marinus S1-08]|uniref:Uncharacterized protein n=1 Tax=Nonlabens marinus S1-08 TaxID=1454201 RepID=W8W000_9FLAO|nr:hypothetical protein NMS_1452 [Nonlabens marinus S1-08]